MKHLVVFFNGTPADGTDYEGGVAFMAEDVVGVYIDEDGVTCVDVRYTNEHVETFFINGEKFSTVVSTIKQHLLVC